MLAPSLDIGRLSAPGRLEISLFLEKFSLIRLWKFPVPLRREFGCRLLNPRVDLTRKSPVSREFGAETGSQLTASVSQTVRSLWAMPDLLPWQPRAFFLAHLLFLLSQMF